MMSLSILLGRNFTLRSGVSTILLKRLSPNLCQNRVISKFTPMVRRKAMQNQQLSRFLSAPRVLGAILLSILLITQQVQYASAAGTGGVPVLRTFEDLPTGKAVFNDYVGVTFPQGSADFHPITIFKPSVATASPSQALQAQLRTAEFHGTQLIMSFD